MVDGSDVEGFVSGEKGFRHGDRTTRTMGLTVRRETYGLFKDK